MQFRRDIQGMRAIAVLAVFIFHLNPAWLPGGFIGVDIFFVISGYLISSIVLSRIERDKFSFLEFYGSRIKRITPAYYAMLILVMLAVVYIAIPSEINLFRLAFKHATIFSSNNYFSGLDTYFGPQSAENPFLHTWTLAIEMQFYLFLPFILFFVRSRKWLLPIVIILTIGLFAYGSIEIFALHNKNAMYFSLLARAPEFLLGVIVSLIPADRIKLGEKRGLALSVLGLMLIIGSTIFITEHSAFPGILAAVPCVGAALLIVAPQNKIRSVLAMEVPFLIGDWSYSIYLWHWPVMALMRYYYSVEIFTLWQYIFVIIATIILSLASYYLIEHPLRKTKGRILYPIVAVLFVGSFVLNSISIPLNRRITKGGILPDMIQFKSNRFKSDMPGIELYGSENPSNDSIILFMGDSHSGNMTVYLDLLGKENNLTFGLLSTPSFPAIGGLTQMDFNDYGIPGLYSKYIEGRDILKKSKVLEKSKIIILQFFNNDSKWKIFKKPFLKFVENLKPDQKLIILSDFPTVNLNPSRINRSQEKITNYKFEIIQPLLNNELLEIINSNPNVHLLDLTQTDGYKKTFVDAPFHNDSLIYYDEFHINSYGSAAYERATKKDFMHKLDSILSLHKKIKE